MSNDVDSKAALRRAAEVLGGQIRVGEVVGLSKQGIWPYFNSNRAFPPEYCPLIESATRAKADESSDPSLIVTCEQLRPDVRWDVLRAHPQEA